MWEVEGVFEGVFNRRSEVPGVRLVATRPMGGGCRTPAGSVVLVYGGFPGLGQGNDEKLLAGGVLTSVFEFHGGSSPEVNEGLHSRFGGVGGAAVMRAGRGCEEPERWGGCVRGGEEFRGGRGGSGCEAPCTAACFTVGVVTGLLSCDRSVSHAAALANGSKGPLTLLFVAPKDTRRSVGVLGIATAIWTGGWHVAVELLPPRCEPPEAPGCLRCQWKLNGTPFFSIKFRVADEMRSVPQKLPLEPVQAEPLGPHLCPVRPVRELLSEMEAWLCSGCCRELRGPVKELERLGGGGAVLAAPLVPAGAS